MARMKFAALALLASLALNVAARSTIIQDVAPADCRVISGDDGFPSIDDIKAVLPMAQPKEGDGRPDFHVSVMNTAEVQAAIKLATKYNIRFSIINSGHDYLGRNDAPSGLSIDVSKLRGVKVVPEFTLSTNGESSLGKDDEGEQITPVAGKQAAISFGPGLTTQEINDAAAKSGLFTLGPGHGEVTVAGGWGLGGGHSPVSATYGLGADQAIEYKVVTPTGELVVANAATNPDLFWALRGGGGSTFGVVVEATVKAFPSPKIAMVGYSFKGDDSKTPTDGYWDAVAQLHHELPALSKVGLQGYYYVYPGRVVGQFFKVGDFESGTTMQSIVGPVIDRIIKQVNVTVEPVDYASFDNYKQFFDDEWGPRGSDDMRRRLRFARDMPEMDSEFAEPNGRSQIDARLLGETHLGHSELAQLLKQALPNVAQGELRGNFVAGPGVHNPSDGVNATSVNPAWRSALVNLVASGAAGPWNADSLRTLAPESGVYWNEASYAEPNWKQSFWGYNYDRLLEIKKKYDPNNILWCTPCVGADLLRIQDDRLCKAPAVAESANSIPPVSDNTNTNDFMEGNEGKTIKKWRPKGY